MTILILNWRDPKNPLSGGAESVTLNHAKYWVKQGNEVIWLAQRLKNSTTYEEIDGVKIIRKGGAFTVYLIAPFYYLFSQIKFDVVIDEIHGIPFFTPLYVYKAKKIAFIHEVAGEIWDYMYKFPFNLIGRFIESLYFIFYRNITFWTDADSTIKDLRDHGINAENIVVIPCPVDKNIRPKLHNKEKNPTFIFVSRLVKMKGIERVIEAFSVIYKKEKKAVLWIVGDGDKDYVVYLKNKIYEIEKQEKLENFSKAIVLWGRVSEVKKIELMGKAHLLLHASIKEGWGLVILEAASQGTPAIVYRVGGLVDTVINGQTGIVIDLNTPQEMAEQALNLLDDKNRYKLMQKNGLERVQKMSWEEAAQKSLVLISK